MSCSCTGDYRGARMAFHLGHAEGTQADNVTIRKAVTTELVMCWSYLHMPCLRRITRAHGVSLSIC